MAKKREKLTQREVIITFLQDLRILTELMFVSLRKQEREKKHGPRKEASS